MSIFQFLRIFDVCSKTFGLGSHFRMRTISVKNGRSVWKFPYLWHVLGHSVLAQGRNEARWRPGLETGWALPRSNLRSFVSKCTLLKKVLLPFRRPPQSFGARRIVLPSLRPCIGWSEYADFDY